MKIGTVDAPAAAHAEAAQKRQEPGGIVCLDLRRSGGCVRYADLMTDSLPISNCYHLISRYRREPLVSSGAKSIEIPTYRSDLEFVASTLVVLPLLGFLFIYLRLRGVDTVYAPYQHFWNPFLFAVARVLGMQVIATFHELYLDPRREYSTAKRFCNRVCCRIAHKFVFLTEFVRDEMKRAGRISPDEPTIVLPHGIIIPAGLRQTVRTHPHREGRVFKFLFFGRVMRHKGIDGLLKAFSQLKESNISLSVIGKWEISRDAVEVPSAGVEVVDEYVSEQALVAAFNSHDALVAPYTSASQSGVVTLGVAARMPMIVTDVGGLSEQVQDGESAVVIPPTVQAITGAMERLMRDKELYESLSANLVYLEKGPFDWDRLASRLVRFCEDSA